MKHEVYKRLSSRRQRQLVLDSGVPLGKRERHNFCIFLFGLEGFYVEVFFYKESGEYCTLHSFDEVDELDPYLQEIHVEDLFEV